MKKNKSKATKFTLKKYESGSSSNSSSVLSLVSQNDIDSKQKIAFSDKTRNQKVITMLSWLKLPTKAIDNILKNEYICS